MDAQIYQSVHDVKSMMGNVRYGDGDDPHVLNGAINESRFSRPISASQKGDKQTYLGSLLTKPNMK